jgi:urease accessory protein
MSRSNRQRWIGAIGALTVVQMLAVAAQAHHPMGGEAPRTMWQGLLSGIGHPVIGPDHLAFVVGVGLLAAIAGYGLMLPALFVGAMTLGLGLHVAGVAVPYAEVMLAVSVVLIGIAVLRPREGGGLWVEGGLFALAGVLHGQAFAEAVIGAETGPVLAYIVGLAGTQLAIAAGAYLLARATPGHAAVLAPVHVRALGLAIAVTGLVVLVMNGAPTA